MNEKAQRTKNCRSLLSALGGTLACLLAAGATFSQAQEVYPSKPIRWIIPYSPGAPIDVNARKLAEIVSRKLNQPILIENKAGASGVIGASAVSAAAPDGYTFLVTVADPLIASTALIASVTYDPMKNFTFITKITAGFPVLVVNPKLKSETLAQFIEAAKAKPLKYASFGPGSFPQIFMEDFNRAAGVKISEVAYRSPPETLQAVLQGEVDAAFIGANEAAQFGAQKAVHALAEIGPSGLALLPGVPSFVDAGYNTPILSTPVWVGVLGPADLPQHVVETMLKAIQTGLADDDLQAFFRTVRNKTIGNSPADFEKEFRQESAAVLPMIKALGLKAQ